MTIELTNENPWRVPDWRWQRANLLATGALRQNRRFDDRHIQKLSRFATAVMGDTDQYAQERLAIADPALFWAYRLAIQDEPHRRGEVEARIIANQTPEEIAAKTGIPEATIKAYEIAFYDVRDKLIYGGYVLHTLIGTAIHRGIQERDYVLIWKFMAYTHGPVLLDAYVKQSVTPAKPKNANAVKACLADGGFGALLRKQYVAALTVPLNQFTQTQVLEVYAKFVEMERVGGQGAGSGSNTIVNNVQQVLALLPLDIGPYSTPRVNDSMMAKYDASSEELPTAQLIEAARGRLSDDSSPRNLKYPEPINHARTSNRDRKSANTDVGQSH
jgi:hypothetical protein